jgi:subtilase family serine protease
MSTKINRQNCCRTTFPFRSEGTFPAVESITSRFRISDGGSTHLGRFGALRQFILTMAIALIVATVAPATADGPATILDGNHPDEAADVVGATAASVSTSLAMRLTMALRHRDDLARLLADQQDPSSPQYHRWLTPDAFTNRFGPADADLARVTRWLKKKGFTVKSADASTREVSFTGTVAQAQNVFGVKIAATTDGHLYSNTGDPSVPAELAPIVESIHGLDNLLHSQPMVHRVSKPASVVNDNGPFFGPPDIYTFYNETPLLNANIDGGGVGCIAVVEDSNIDQPAADAFNTQFGLPALTGSNFSTVLVDGSDPGVAADQDETMVDVSYSHAVAPGSSIRIYLGDQKHTSSPAILDAIHAAVTDKSNPLCSAISISFSFCGGSKRFYKTQNGFFAQAAAQGQSVFVATGDTGAAGLKLSRNGTCVTGTSRNINELGASPNVTAIGGTEFSPNYSGGNDVGSVSESVWNDRDGAAGGGESKVFKKPAFQNGLIKKDKMRDVPDISFGASPSTPGFFLGGRLKGAPAAVCCIGGTSLGAPAWAGLSQLISQSNNARIGNLNTRIYQLGAKTDGATTGIRDVTSGNTNFNHVTGFSATTGYDKASGWGTVDMSLFVPAFLAP